MTELMKTLVLLSAVGSLLGLLLMLARRVGGKRLPSTLWYYAWLPVLLRLVLPLPGLIPEAQAIRESRPAAAQEETWEKRSYRYDGYEEHPVIDADAEEGEAPAAAAVAAYTEPVGAAAPDVTAQVRVQRQIVKSPLLWLGIWLAGAALCFTRYAAGYVRFRRALMDTLETTDGSTARVYRALAPQGGPLLFCSAYVKTPMLLGLARPMIVLPRAEFPAETAENILRHELTHYRRGDLYVKWLFVAAASFHWFNPLMLLFRRELDRVCELSCDEHVLARMAPSQRRSYGETLLDLAANRTLPAGVVATTFATEKRALKERLEQIMKFRYKPRAILALTAAAVLLLSLLALAAGPARTSASSADAPLPTPEPPASELASDELFTASVSDVDALLAAIAPDTQILLAPGTYDLSAASDYGQETDSDYYRWEQVNDGYELVIENVTALHITGTAEDTVISALPRYADVLAFRDCQSIKLSGVTLGHTKEQGVCAGGVLHLMGTNDTAVSGCALYGCGILGVEAENCQNIFVKDCDIYECSNGALWLTSCRNVRFDGCEFRDCYNRWGDGKNPAFQIFRITSCYGVAITDGHVYGNYAQNLMQVDWSQEVYLLGTLFEENDAMGEEYLPGTGTVLSVSGEPVIVAGCQFRDDFPIYTNGESTTAVDLSGRALSYDDLAGMQWEHVDFPGFAPQADVPLDRTQNADGTWEVHVSTVDEFLAAIAPDTTVYLDKGTYYLTDASNYGAYGSQYYYWVDMYDGPGLVISGVENLSIVGAGKDVTGIEALPRYADVIRFDNCRNISVHDVTAGHTLGAGMCAGAVLDFTYCEGLNVSGCGLFGCGTYGVVAANSLDITVEENEIYECSYGAVELDRCAGAVFAENDIHDCAFPTYGIFESLDITIDGEPVADQALDELDPFFAEYLSQEPDSPILDEIFGKGRIIFDADIDIPGAGPYYNPKVQG